MSIQVQIQGTTYSLPGQGQNPPWGEDLSAIIQALIVVANTQSGTGDIQTSSFNVANNQVAPANVTGMAFDSAQIRTGIISYSLDRATSTQELSEGGQLIATYNSMSSSWELIRYAGGNSDVIFSITNAGQVQFISSNMSGSGYVGLIRFNAKAFAQ